MRRRGRVLILLGLILAIVAFILAYFLLQGAAAPPPPEIQTAQVLVALQPITERTEVPVESVGPKEFPLDAVPPNALRDPSDVLGKFAIVPIFPGQVIVAEMLVDKAEAQKTGLYASFAIPPGKVAMAMPITDLSNVARAIQAGDFVDVLVTIRYKVVEEEVSPEGAVAITELGESLVVQLTLQDVEVLKVGLWGPTQPSAEEGGQQTQQQQQQQQQARARGPEFLTLLVSQQDALVLKFARDDPSFTVDFALRGVGDHTLVTTDSVTLEYLLTRFNITQPTALPRIIAPP